MAHHRRGLRRLLEDDDLAERLEQDYESAGLASRRVALLRYVEKLTRDPGTMQRSDVEALRDEGLGDGDILHVVEVAAYYAYVNRIADGLGVVLER